ncbi:MAG TPA: nicotinate-nucleotide adenylyltransferase [Candidatus Kapabacteria bacterium]|nr:nicotinate-nucleotide adenylyltransferase [Candidatus Kapabacteria bacterium]
MRIGILGGTFDPPHLAHLIASERAVETFALDRLLFVPANIPPNKSEPLSSSSDRLAMTRLAIEENSKFNISEIEMSRPGVSYSIDTIRLLKSQWNPAKIFLFIGNDQFAAFGSWHEPEEILREAEVVVMTRPLEYPIAKSPYDSRVKFMDIPLLQISSTDIRERVRAGTSIRYLVPEAVQAYIVEHGLYLK